MLINGVRGRTGAAALTNESGASNSLRERVDIVSDPRNLDGSVEEVFATMLGLECRRQNAVGQRGPERVTAIVGFGGLLSGACVFSCPSQVAIKIAAQMTDMEFAEVDDTVKDAMGEICNMVAGAWKGKVPELAAHCALSVPTVITGRDYILHVQSPEFQLQHGYRFDDSLFSVTIVCDSLL